MRNINVELDYNAGADTAVIGLRSDTFTNFGGRLTGNLKYSIAVKTWVQGEQGNSSLSTIDFVNADGGLDSLSEEDFTECRIYENIDGTRTLLATGEVDKAVLVGEDLFRVTLKGTSKILDIPLQSNVYPASETSESDILVTNTYYGREDVTRPIAIGTCYSIPPVLSNRSINEYACHDDDFAALGVVYDNGIAVTATKHNSAFVLSANPSGRVVADILGQIDPLAGVPIYGNARSLEDLVRYFLGKVSFTNYSTSDLDAIDADKGVYLNYYQNGENPQTINFILQWLMNSITGYMYNAPDGELRFGTLNVPSVTATTDIIELNVLSDIIVTNDLAKNISSKFGGDRNWYVYNQDDIVVGATAQNQIDLAQQHRSVKDSATAFHSSIISKDKIHDTLLNSGAFIQQEVDLIGTIYSVKRRFYAFDSSVSAEIGETVELTHSRFGLSAGKKLVCVGYDIDFINNTYRIILWG